MRRTILTTIAVLALATTTFIASAAVLRSDRPDTPRVPVRISKTAATRIATAQAAIAKNPRAHQAYAALATAALERFRETGDPTWYAKADDAATRALTIRPRNVEAIDALATLAASRHRFREALRLANRSLAIEPDHFAPLGIKADALIELGRYEQGFAAITNRLALRPDPASYSRAAYAAELTGDRERAISLMQQAVESSPPGSEARAWNRVQLGLLRLGGADRAGAEAEMRRALMERPGDARATAGLARTQAAAGAFDAAIAGYEAAVDAMPLPEYAAALVEIDIARDDTTRLPQDRALLDAMLALQAEAGVQIDLDRALIDADLRTPSPADVARARRAYATRPGVIGDEILGWVLTRAGRCDEALTYARRSLRLGTRDAMVFFHAGAAAACAGADDDARNWLRAALDLNPMFSVRWAPEARRLLKEVTS